jgi:hypothetical protein
MIPAATDALNVAPVDATLAHSMHWEASRCDQFDETKIASIKRAMAGVGNSPG